MPPAESGPHGPTRATPLWLPIAACILLVARVATGIHEHAHPPGPTADRVEWVPLEEAPARVAATHRPLLYDFSAGWSSPCRRMEREVFAESGAAAQISRRYVPVRVIDRLREDGRNPAAVDSLQHLYGVESFPTLVVVYPDSGRHFSEAGFQGRDRTLRFLGNPEGKSIRERIREAQADSVGAR